MALLQQIKKQVFEAMKAKDTVAKDVLRVVQGDIELAETRQGKPLTQDEEEKIVRKLIKSNQETLAVMKDPAGAQKLEREIKILDALLPKMLGVDEIVAALSAVASDIKAAGNDGQATGLAMKHLKPLGLPVDGKDVSAAVKQIRGA